MRTDLVFSGYKGGMKTRSRACVEPLVWGALWLLYPPLVRQVQPSWSITALADGILLAASAGTLHGAKFILHRERRWTGWLAASLFGAVCGTLAAILIRQCYDLLAPGVVPFGFVFNAVVDIVWAALHAGIIWGLLKLLLQGPQ